jgi:hypothetical protein
MEELRDDFAIKILQSLLQNSEYTKNIRYYTLEMISMTEDAYVLADMMLRAKYKRNYQVKSPNNDVK